MIPILYDVNETEFTSNGLCRLNDVIEAKVVEERNGLYEADFSYPIDGENYDLIQVGRIIGVTHDESGDVQPFDIVSFTKPIDGVVEFHCTHISYRQSYLTVRGKNINSLADALILMSSAEPDNPFSYKTDKESTGFMAAADGIPRTVRSMLGGVEGSILDTYGGEYEWDKFNVILHTVRGTDRDFSIRYGVNMLNYEEEFDVQGTYSSCIPYWTDDAITVIGDRQESTSETITGRGECVPLDLTDKFEEKPTKAQLELMARTIMDSNNPTIPGQTIHVEFVRLQDLGYEGFDNLFQCNLCDTINVVFPFYNTSGRFKISKITWDVLADRYESMELGDLSVTLSEALGISSNGSTANNDNAPTPKPTNLMAIDTFDVDNVSINAGSTKYNGWDFDISKTGYTPIAVAGFNIANGSSSGTGANACTLYRLQISSGALEVSMRNNGSGTAKIRLYVTILYRAT